MIDKPASYCRASRSPNCDGRGRLDGLHRHFTHLKDGAEAKDRTLLLSAILGDAINLGLTKMAESSPGLTYAKLSWLQAWQSATKPIRRPWPSWSTTSIATLCRPLGRRHDLILRWPALPRGWPGREHRARQPEVR
ncbi:Tn3 family transposase (plasmid) [Salmonella enterica subsp. enterica]|uniref:Tn3 family transposase n=1 Tax=Salmonella enterica TaxID=28901 RepID=UPI000EB67D10|nr:hypothetical protein CJD41_24130 [Salmonella enterica subsp. enterica serovar Pullorum]